MDQLPPNVPRVLDDGFIDIQQGQRVPVLIQTASHTLIVLNSAALAHLQVGQNVFLCQHELEPAEITISRIDNLSLIANYTDVVPDLH